MERWGKQACDRLAQNTLSRLVVIRNTQNDLPIKCSQVKSILCALLGPSTPVDIHFVKTPRIVKLHRQFFQDDNPTDCITLPYHSPFLLGEIFICPAAALTYVAKHGGDPYRETTLYLVHGILHLLGYEDTEPRKKNRMRRAEKKWITALEAKGLLLT